MKVKIVLLIVIALLLALDYVLVVIAHDADEMYRRWKSERSDSEADR